MKRLFLLSAIICMQVLTVFAQGPTSRVNAKKVSLFRQPVYEGEVLRTLTPEDEIIIMRQHNKRWTLVQIEGEAGYVPNRFLKERKGRKETAAKTSDALNKSAKM